MNGPHQSLNRLGSPLPQRVAVFRALALGDMLCAVPSLRALRTALPKAHIVLVGLPWARDFVRRYGQYLDGFLEFPGYPGLEERIANIGQIPGFLHAAQQARFDLAIQMHGSGLLTNSLTALFGARHTAGFYLPGHWCPDPERFLAYPEQEPEVRRPIRLMEFLGIPACGDDLEFSVRDEDYETLQAIPQARRLQPGTYVCIHPGASRAIRRWKTERFAAVADALAQNGLKVVITGSLAEAELAEAVRRQMKMPAVSLAGRTSLGALAALLSAARLVVCNDTGVSHLAAALRVPSVITLLSSDPLRWAPLDAHRHRVVAHPVDCRPCRHEVCPIGFPCCEGITVDSVTQRALELLADFQQEVVAGDRA